jgi:hypothetical protein
MQHTQLTDQVRDIVRTELSKFGLAEDEPHETILIAHGYYAGRRFEAACGYALWFLEEGQIKVYRAGGKLVKTLGLTSAPRDLARAA